MTTKQQKQPVTVAVATSELQNATKTLDAAREALAAAEGAYASACQQFDDAVAATRKELSR